MQGLFFGNILQGDYIQLYIRQQHCGIMVIRIRQEDGGKLRPLVPHPQERRKRVKIVIGEWDNSLKKLAKKSDILVLAKPHDLKSSERKGAFLVKGPGEYEIKGVFIKGIADSGDSPIYVVIGEDVRACYMHSFAQKELDADTLEGIGDANILLVPLELDNLPPAKRVKNIITQIDPLMIVFFQTRMKKSSSGKKSNQEKLSKWIKRLDVKSFEQEEELVFSKSDFKEDKTQFFVLSGEQ